MLTDYMIVVVLPVVQEINKVLKEIKKKKAHISWKSTNVPFLTDLIGTLATKTLCVAS